MNTRTRALKIAGLMGLLGPLPGYVVFAARNFIVASDIEESLRLFVYFYAGAVVLFGWYCFIIGLVAALLHDKLNALGMPRPARTGVIVMLGVAAAVPTILLEGGSIRGLGVAGSISAAFWIAAYLILVHRQSRRPA